jgi:hypothetical protein
VSLITPADVTALVDTDLTDAELQVVIDREEAALASLIGPLTGVRTEVFYLTHPQADARLTLRRPTDAVEVFDNGDIVASDDVRLLADHRTLLRLASDTYVYAKWIGPVEATYEPNDQATLERVLIELTSLSINAPSVSGGLASETIGSYSYTNARTMTAQQTNEQRRRAAYATLLPPRRPTSIHLRSSNITRWPLLGTVRPSVPS